MSGIGDYFLCVPTARPSSARRIDYGASIEHNRRVFEEKWGCSLDVLHRLGAAAIEPERIARLRHLPLPVQPEVEPAAAVGEGPVRGELRVEELLLRARDAVLGHDLPAVRAVFAEAAGWDDPQRAYQARRRLAELVLADPAMRGGDAWIGALRRRRRRACSTRSSASRASRCCSTTRACCSTS